VACVVHGGTVLGVEGLPVGVEVDLLRRLPAVVIVGLPGGAIRESADRVRSAIQQAGFEFPKKRVVINLSPADLPKTGTGFDLPIAVGILAASDQVESDRLADTAFVAELSLDGRLRPVRGILPLALMARAQGVERIVVAPENAAEAAVVRGLQVLAAPDLEALCEWLDGKRELPPGQMADALPDDNRLCLSEVRGQHRARRALEIAAAGGHNLLMLGSPGCGKTMLAARLPTILPDLSFDEAVDITRVHSVAGLLGDGGGLVTQRPFRAPHHSVSPAGMVGNSNLQPGEVSLAHHGVLFLDELPEFRRDVLELLRAPLEDREIRLSRARGTIRFPASISLIAAANPCPCGYLGHPTKPCVCPPGTLERYAGRLSGPLLDRIDLQVWVQPVPAEELVRGTPGEASRVVRQRVAVARRRQRERLQDTGASCNAELVGDAIRDTANPSDAALRLLRDLVDRHSLSARSWSRLLKVARTVADLEGADGVLPSHVLEASQFRLHNQDQERPCET
jgi:magnesium chelatase family protein